MDDSKWHRNETVFSSSYNIIQQHRNYPSNGSVHKQSPRNLTPSFYTQLILRLWPSGSCESTILQSDTKTDTMFTVNSKNDAVYSSKI